MHLQLQTPSCLCAVQRDPLTMGLYPTPFSEWSAILRDIPKMGAHLALCHSDSSFIWCVFQIPLGT